MVYSTKPEVSQFSINVDGIYSNADNFIMALTRLVSEPLLENQILEPVALVEPTFPPSTEAPQIEDSFKIK